jgi:hypothetical protein
MTRDILSIKISAWLSYSLNLRSLWQTNVPWNRALPIAYPYRSQFRIQSFGFEWAAEGKNVVELPADKLALWFRVMFFLGMLAKVRKTTASLFSLKFDIWVFFENLSRKFTFHYKLARITGTLHENLCAFIIISRWILLRMRNVLDKILEKLKTHILCPITYFQKSCRLWENKKQYGRVRHARYDNIIRCLRFACWIIKATDTHSEYLILTAFLLQ